MAARTDFDQHLRNDELLPVYAVVGADTMLVREAIDALRARALTRAPDFNRDELRAGETPIERAVDAARTMPMMAERRWVHVAQIDKLKTADQPALLSYLEKPSATTVLCLSGEKIDQRTKLGQALNAAKALFAFEPPRQHELAGWITRRVRKHGSTIDPDAAQLVADLLGAELGSLDMALEKLVLYAGPGTPITTEQVEAVVAPTRVHSIFNLTDAIGARDLGQASRLLRNALGGGENALMVLGMIARQFRQLLQLKELHAERASNQQIMQALGIRPFLLEPLNAQARRYSQPELCAALEAIRRADLRLKSTRLDPGVVLDSLLVEVVRAERRAP